MSPDPSLPGHTLPRLSQDSLDDDSGRDSFSFGSLFRLIPQVGSLLAQITGQQSDTLEQLKAELLKLQIAELRGDTGQVLVVPPHQLLQMAADPNGRQDWIVAGERGFGKTAFACWLAQELGEALELPVYSIDMDPKTTEPLGFGGRNTSQLNTLRDAVVLVDESALGAGRTGKPRPELRDLCAVARHRNVSLLWVTQNLAGISPDILRHGANLALKYLDPIAAKFDRDEMQPLLHKVTALQAQYEELRIPTGITTVIRGQFYASANPLPRGWTEEVSTWKR